MDGQINLPHFRDYLDRDHKFPDFIADRNAQSLSFVGCQVTEFMFAFFT